MKTQKTVYLFSALFQEQLTMAVPIEENFWPYTFDSWNFQFLLSRYEIILQDTMRFCRPKVLNVSLCHAPQKKRTTIWADSILRNMLSG